MKPSLLYYAPRGCVPYTYTTVSSRIRGATFTQVALTHTRTHTTPTPRCGYLLRHRLCWRQCPSLTCRVPRCSVVSASVALAPRRRVKSDLPTAVYPHYSTRHLYLCFWSCGPSCVGTYPERLSLLLLATLGVEITRRRDLPPSDAHFSRAMCVHGAGNGANSERAGTHQQ